MQRLIAVKQWLQPGNMIIAFATIVHLTWGLCLLFSRYPLRTTGIDLALKLTGGSPTLAGLIFLTAGILATLAVSGRFRGHCQNLALIAPQQILLLVSAIEAFACIMDGTFADGTVKNMVFLFVDQFWLILLYAFHSIAVTTRHLCPTCVRIYYMPGSVRSQLAIVQ